MHSGSAVSRWWAIVFVCSFTTAFAPSASAQSGPCLPGMSVVEAGKCCWPGQDWIPARQVCRGIPTCPAGLEAQGETCSPATASAPSPAEPARSPVAPSTVALPSPPPALPPAPPPPAKAEDRRELQRTAGTMQVGGPLSFTVAEGKKSSGDNVFGYVLTLEPYFGIFVAKGFELTASISYELKFGDLYSTSWNSTLAGYLGARYVFGWSGAKVNPYISLRAGPQIFMPEEGGNRTYLSVIGQVGILVPLTRNTALDFGIAAQVRTLLDGDSSYSSYYFFPAGFLGVTSFF